MIEALLYHYAYGKPVDQVRLENQAGQGQLTLIQMLDLAWTLRQRGGLPPVPDRGTLDDGGQGDEGEGPGGG